MAADVRERKVLMESRDFCGEASKRRRNRIELDLFDFRICVEL